MSFLSRCSSLDDLQRLLTGAVDDAEAESLEEHLQACTACFGRFKTLSAKDALVEALQNCAGRDEPPPDGIMDELIPQLKALCPSTPGRGHVATATPGPERDAQLPLPVLPGYEILGELGRGGMGVVYQAR